jgi:hypothetical protein
MRVAIAAAIALSMTFALPALAKPGNGNGWGQGEGGGRNHGAPGPLIGAGLPVLLVVGGAYWAVRRFRKAT